MEATAWRPLAAHFDLSWAGPRRDRQTCRKEDASLKPNKGYGCRCPLLAGCSTCRLNPLSRQKSASWKHPDTPSTSRTVLEQWCLSCRPSSTWAQRTILTSTRTWTAGEPASLQCFCWEVFALKIALENDWHGPANKMTYTPSLHPKNLPHDILRKFFYSPRLQEIQVHVEIDRNMVSVMW